MAHTQEDERGQNKRTGNKRTQKRRRQIDLKTRNALLLITFLIIGLLPSSVSAIDNHGNNTLDLVGTVDDNYYRGQPDDYLLLDFGNVDISNGAKLVLRADNQFKPDKECVHVQVYDATEGWMDVVALRTRLNWATEIVDLSDYLPDADGELKARLYFTEIHLIDYVDLDTTKQDDFDLYHANLVSAIHSQEGSIKTELLESDDTYAELVPWQQIELAFTLPEDSKDTRTFITHVEGHYCTIG